MSSPGNADVPVGPFSPGSSSNAGGDAGAPGNGVPSNPPREWYSRGYLPHRNAWDIHQSITYRLADSLPRTKLKSLEAELADLAENQREAERRKRIEAWLDSGMGCCALAHPEVARYVQDSWLKFHGDRYVLHAWCVMPNHVHVLIQPLEDLATIVQGWKSFTARWILRQNDSLSLGIPERDRLWMREYWDRFMRDENHYQKTVAYIHQNPVSAGLCATPAEWPWSSAHPGNADVPVGFYRQADGDAGAPGKNVNP